MPRFVSAFCLAIVASGAAAQDCPAIRFAEGTASGAVSGAVSDGAPSCFDFASAAGQTAHLQLSGSQNACFSVIGVADCQSDLSFPTGSGNYRVIVVQLFPRPVAEEFSLRLSIR